MCSWNNPVLHFRLTAIYDFFPRCCCISIHKHQWKQKPVSAGFPGQKNRACHGTLGKNNSKDQLGSMHDWSSTVSAAWGLCVSHCTYDVEGKWWAQRKLCFNQRCCVASLTLSRRSGRRQLMNPCFLELMSGVHEDTSLHRVVQKMFIVPLWL